MTKEKLKEASDLLNKINDLKSYTESAKKAPCTNILFTFGNHSNRPTVCENPESIIKVRDLIVELNEAELKDLQTKFDNL